MTAAKPDKRTLNLTLPNIKRRPRVLVVDDQPLYIRIAHQLLSEEYDVYMATSGLQAVDFCRNTPPDLVLLDLMMPEMDGLEVCRRLREDPVTSDLPVIFITSEKSEDSEYACLAIGGVDFVRKPFDELTLRLRVYTQLKLKFQSDDLRQLAFIERLTEIPNRRFLNDRLDREWRRCARNQQSLSAILIDVDHFKTYNDHYGHLAGDLCLQKIAKTISNTCGRPFDIVARYGGEEFCCILPETNTSGAARVAEQIQAGIAKLAIPHEKSDTSSIVTASMGVATLIPNEESLSIYWHRRTKRFTKPRKMDATKSVLRSKTNRVALGAIPRTQRQKHRRPLSFF